MVASFFRIAALVRKELLAMLKDHARAPCYSSRPPCNVWCSAMS